MNHFRKIFQLVGLFVFLQVSSSLVFAAVADGILSEGVYSGTFTKLDGNSTPLVLSLSYTGTDEDAPSDEMWPIKRRLQGSFIIGGEGGPYNLSYANYNFDTGKVELQYSRQQRGEPSLYFHGTWSQTGTISGSVTGLHDVVGKFSVHMDQKAKMEVHSVIGGKYNGHATYVAGGTVPLSIRLDSSPSTTQNPPDMELDFTAGHVGGFVLQSWQGSLSHVYINYLRDTIQMVYQEGNSGTLIYDGQFHGDSITGTMNSSLRGRTGTFTVKRVDQ